MRTDSANCAMVNRITIQREIPQNHFNVPTSNSSKEDSVISFAIRHYIKDVTSPQQIREMMQLDYSELHHTRNIPGTERSESVEDKRFCDILTTNIHKNEMGNWEMPLPFKTDDVTLPNNREQCLKRLLGIKRKLLKNGKTLKHYMSSCRRSLTRTTPVSSHQRNWRPLLGKSGTSHILTSTTPRNQIKFE